MKHRWAVFVRVNASQEWEFGGFLEHDEQVFEAEEMAEMEETQIKVVDLT